MKRWGLNDREPAYETKPEERYLVVFEPEELMEEQSK